MFWLNFPCLVFRHSYYPHSGDLFETVNLDVDLLPSSHPTSIRESSAPVGLHWVRTVRHVDTLNVGFVSVSLFYRLAVTEQHDASCVCLCHLLNVSPSFSVSCSSVFGLLLRERSAPRRSPAHLSQLFSENSWNWSKQEGRCTVGENCLWTRLGSNALLSNTLQYFLLFSQ